MGTDGNAGNQSPLPYVCPHVRARTEEHRDVDCAVASVAALLDLLLIGFFLMVGGDGIWTADWMGYPGPVDATGASYQGDVVRFSGWAPQNQRPRPTPRPPGPTRATPPVFPPVPPVAQWFHVWPLRIRP